jgi:GATA-binding protein, other eukaryote
MEASALNLQRPAISAPSAEDLDAAQQLISSARGMRPILAFSQQERIAVKGDVDWQTADKENMSDAMDTTPDQASDAGDAHLGPHPSSKPPGRDTAFLGHSCR